MVHKSGRLARSAGTSPKIMPVRKVSASVNERIRKSGLALISNGFPSAGTSASNPRVMPIASSTPAAPPANDSTMLSTSS